MAIRPVQLVALGLVFVICMIIFLGVYVSQLHEDRHHLHSDGGAGPKNASPQHRGVSFSSGVKDVGGGGGGDAFGLYGLDLGPETSPGAQRSPLPDEGLEDWVEGQEEGQGWGRGWGANDTFDASSKSTFVTYSSTLFWLITNPEGAAVHRSLLPCSAEAPLQKLPSGFVAAGNALQQVRYQYPQGQGRGRGAVVVTRLLLTFPLRGWTTVAQRAETEQEHEQGMEAGVGAGAEAEKGALRWWRLLDTSYHQLPPAQAPTHPNSLLPTPAMLAPSACGNVTLLLRVDFKGGDLHPNIHPSLASLKNPQHTPSAAHCCALCCATPYCSHWTRTGGGDCWLKSSLAKVMAVKNTGVGTKGTGVGNKNPGMMSGSLPGGAVVGGKRVAGGGLGVVSSVCDVRAGLPLPPRASWDTGAGAGAGDVGSTVPCCDVPPTSRGSRGSTGGSGGRGSGRRGGAVVRRVADELLCSGGSGGSGSSGDSGGKGGVRLLDSWMLTTADADAGAGTEVEAAGLGGSAWAGRAIHVLDLIPPGTGPAPSAPVFAPASPYIIALHSRVGGDWSQQLPVGTGRVGALVGGGLRGEVLPVSVAGLYVRKKTRPHPEKVGGGDKLKKKDEVKDKGKDGGWGKGWGLGKDKGKGGADGNEGEGGVGEGGGKEGEGAGKGGEGRGEKAGDGGAAVRRARAQFLSGDFAGAEKSLSSSIRGDLGTFQYVADLAVVYSADPMRWAPPPPQVQAQSGPAGKRGVKGKGRLNPALAKKQAQQGRAGVLDALKRQLGGGGGGGKEGLAGGQAGAGGIGGGVGGGFGAVLLSDALLDTRQGVAHSLILESGGLGGRDRGGGGSGSGTRGGRGGGSRGGGSGGGSYTRLHHREWFASERAQVLVGAMRCTSMRSSTSANTSAGMGTGGIGSEEVQGSGCLNVALQLLREDSPQLPALASFHASPLSLTPLQLKGFTDSEGGREGAGVGGDAGLGQRRKTEQRPPLSSSLFAFSFNLTLQSAPSTLLPPTALCAAVVCVGNPGTGTGTGGSGFHASLHGVGVGVGAGAGTGAGASAGVGIGAALPVVLCNGASAMHVFVAVESAGNVFDSSRGGGSGGTWTEAGAGEGQGLVLAEVHRRCGERLRCALDEGVGNLSRRHTQSFARRMGGVDVSFDDPEGEGEEEGAGMGGNLRNGKGGKAGGAEEAGGGGGGGGG